MKHLIIAAASAFAAFAGISYMTFSVIFLTKPKKQNNIHKLPKSEQYLEKRDRMHELVDALAKVPCEKVSIRSYDGLKLTGRYYHTADGAPLDIGFHGYRATAIRDFSGGAKISFELGHNLLLVDQRAHGESEGKTICFGIRERYDCLEWINYAVSRFGENTQVNLYGVSMGAATVLMASGLELPSNVRHIVADCPYSSPKDIICKVAKDYGLSPKLLWPFISAGARLFGKFDPAETSAADAVKNAEVPILIIHGEDDRFVPDSMSLQVQEANPEKVTRQTFPDAGHGISFLKDPERYRKIVIEFLNS